MSGFGVVGSESCEVDWGESIMRVWQILGILLIVVLVVVLVFLYRLAAYVAKPVYHTVEDTSKLMKDQGFWRDYDAMKKEEWRISSYDGYIIHATYIPAAEPGDRYVIISHGYTGNRMGSLKYMHLFHELGYNCLIYDNRSHGDNRRGVCTMGKRESSDLLALIGYVYRRFGDDIYLGLHGESMGAALQIMALREKPRLQFIINDCGFARLMDVITHNAGKLLHLPRWICYPASLASLCYFGFSYAELNPIDVLKENRVPICFIHGAKDDFIPCSHSEQMCAATQGYSELHLFPEAEHAQSIDSDETLYAQVVRDFLQKIKERSYDKTDRIGS